MVAAKVGLAGRTTIQGRITVMETMRNGRLRWLAVLASLMLVMAACGSDSDREAGAPDQDQVVEAEPEAT